MGEYSNWIIFEGMQMLIKILERYNRQKWSHKSALSALAHGNKRWNQEKHKKVVCI